MKLFALIATILTGALLLYGTADFPAWGDPDSPASTHVSAGYIENVVRETHTPNLVAAVLGDYRAYDTMFELVVIYSAGIGVIGVLRRIRE